MTKFKLSEIQANHILDMPLRRLTKLARTELQDEHTKLLEDIKYFNSLLKDPKLLRGVIKEEILRDPQEARRRAAHQDHGRRGRPRHRGPDRRGGRDHHRSAGPGT